MNSKVSATALHTPSPLVRLSVRQSSRRRLTTKSLKGTKEVPSWEEIQGWVHTYDKSYRKPDLIVWESHIIYVHFQGGTDKQRLSVFYGKSTTKKRLASFGVCTVVMIATIEQSSFPTIPGILPASQDVQARLER